MTKELSAGLGPGGSGGKVKEMVEVGRAREVEERNLTEERPCSRTRVSRCAEVVRGGEEDRAQLNMIGCLDYMQHEVSGRKRRPRQMKRPHVANEVVAVVVLSTPFEELCSGVTAHLLHMTAVQALGLLLFFAHRTAHLTKRNLKVETLMMTEAEDDHEDSEEEEQASPLSLRRT